MYSMKVCKSRHLAVRMASPSRETTCQTVILRSFVWTVIPLIFVILLIWFFWITGIISSHKSPFRQLISATFRPPSRPLPARVTTAASPSCHPFPGRAPQRFWRGTYPPRVDLTPVDYRTRIRLDETNSFLKSLFHEGIIINTQALRQSGGDELEALISIFNPLYKTNNPQIMSANEALYPKEGTDILERLHTVSYRTGTCATKCRSRITSGPTGNGASKRRDCPQTGSLRGGYGTVLKGFAAGSVVWSHSAGHFHKTRNLVLKNP